jgi:hypothetical protein
MKLLEAAVAEPVSGATAKAAGRENRMCNTAHEWATYTGFTPNRLAKMPLPGRYGKSELMGLTGARATPTSCPNRSCSSGRAAIVGQRPRQGQGYRDDGTDGNNSAWRVRAATASFAVASR